MRDVTTSRYAIRAKRVSRRFSRRSWTRKFCRSGRVAGWACAHWWSTRIPSRCKYPSTNNRDIFRRKQTKNGIRWFILYGFDGCTPLFRALLYIISGKYCVPAPLIIFNARAKGKKVFCDTSTKAHLYTKRTNARRSLVRFSSHLTLPTKSTSFQNTCFSDLNTLSTQENSCSREFDKRLWDLICLCLE